MTFIFEKLKLCPDCGNKQKVEEESYHCNNCGAFRVTSGTKNYFKLKTEFLAEDFIEKFNEKTRVGKDVRKIERAIENYQSE